ncbi:MAG: hypothetical protein M0001_13905 [Treponema sp.]|nr:hypothetical protein [Treponema sp.]
MRTSFRHSIAPRSGRKARVISILAVAFFVLPSFFLASSCSLGESRLVTIWTDVPEVAIYAELFNQGQQRWRAEVVWKADLPRALSETKTPPDLAIGARLRVAGIRELFRPLDYLFGELAVDQSAFYGHLLAFGTSDGQQLLLPLSFNLPAILFRKDANVISPSTKTLGLADLVFPAEVYDKVQGTGYSRMGFSPRWNSDFLVVAAAAEGADFREGKPLAWSEPGLREAIRGIGEWGGVKAPTATAADDFQFKYLFTPEYNWIAEGRALFAYIDSSRLFLVPEEKSAVLDYRWYAEGSSIPVLSNLVLVGIPKSRQAVRGSEAFIAWLFNPSKQQAILEAARRTRALEGSFGIAGGFSTLRSVTEEVFPLYWANLAGHIPPESMIRSPQTLPLEWPAIKAEVLGPWLKDIIGKPSIQTNPGGDLAAKLAEWLKNGRGG